jgi:hypothetical protein
VDDDRLIEAAAIPWFVILAEIKRNPDAIYQIDPFKMDEIIAGAYKAAPVTTKWC